MGASSASQRTAFVFAGGGSLGAVQVGMLKALTRHGVVPDLVVGASVGAINGAYFAKNPTSHGVAELERIWRRLHRRHIFPISPISQLLGVLGRRNHFIVSGLQLRVGPPGSYRRGEHRRERLARLSEGRLD